jgi:hypothetical protein
MLFDSMKFNSIKFNSMKFECMKFDSMGYFFLRLKVRINFDGKSVGLKFGRFFTDPSGANPITFEFTATTPSLQ